MDRMSLPQRITRVNRALARDRDAPSSPSG